MNILSRWLGGAFPNRKEKAPPLFLMPMLMPKQATFNEKCAIYLNEDYYVHNAGELSIECGVYATYTADYFNLAEENVYHYAGTWDILTIFNEWLDYDDIARGKTDINILRWMIWDKVKGAERAW